MTFLSGESVLTAGVCKRP